MIKNKRIIAIALSAMLAGELVSPQMVNASEMPVSEASTIEINKDEDATTEKPIEAESASTEQSSEELDSKETISEETTSVEENATTSEETTTEAPSSSNEVTESTQETTEDVPITLNEATATSNGDEDSAEDEENSAVYNISSLDDLLSDTDNWELGSNGYTYLGEQDVTINLTGDLSAATPLTSNNAVKLTVHGQGNTFGFFLVSGFSKMVVDHAVNPCGIVYIPATYTDCSLSNAAYCAYDTEYNNCTLDNVDLRQTNGGSDATVTLNNCKITGTNRGIGESGGYRVVAANCDIQGKISSNTNLAIKDCKVKDGIINGKGQLFTMINTTLEMSDQFSGYALVNNYANTYTIKNCQFTGRGQHYGFMQYASQNDCVMQDCSFDNFHSGIYRQGGGTTAEKIINCSFTNCKTGFNAGSGASPSIDTVFEIYKSNNSQGYNELKGCTFDNCEKGIYAYGCVINDCTFTDCNYGAYLYSASTLINNCTFYVPSSEAYGIYQSTGEGIFSINNNFYGEGTGAYLPSGHSYLANCKFRNKECGVRSKSLCTLYNCNFIGNTRGLECDNSPHMITSCTFLNCQEYGVKMGIGSMNSAYDYNHGYNSVLFNSYTSNDLLKQIGNAGSMQEKRNIFQNCGIGIMCNEVSSSFADILISNCKIGYQGTNLYNADNIEISDCEIGINTNSLPEIAGTGLRKEQSNGIIVQNCKFGHKTLSASGSVYNYGVPAKDKLYERILFKECETGLKAEACFNSLGVALESCETGIDLGCATSGMNYWTIQAKNCGTAFKAEKSTSPMTFDLDSKFEGNTCDVDTKSNIKLTCDDLSADGLWNLNDDAVIITDKTELIGNLNITGSVDGTYAGREVAQITDVADKWDADAITYETKGYRVVSEVMDTGTDDEYTSYKLDEGFTLTYDYTTNGGTSMSDKAKKTYSVNSDVSLTATAEKDGYEFVGWSETPNGKAADCVSNLVLNDDKTVYAVFKKDLKVKYIGANNQVLYTDTATLYNNQTGVKYGITHQEDAANKFQDGTLVGFADRRDSASIIPLNQNIYITADTNLYGVYQFHGQIEYVIDGVSHKTVTDSKLCSYDAIAKDKVYTYQLMEQTPKKGYTALGWSETQDNSDRTFPSGYNYSTTKSKATLYAQYKVIPCQEVILNPDEITIATTEKAQMHPVINPSNASTKDLVWTSDNEAIASVDENGMILGKTEGDCIITGITSDGSNLSCQVKVKVYTRNVSITGKLVNSNNKPLSNKKVWIEETDESMTTDANGRFSLTGRKAGEYTAYIYQGDQVLSKTKVSVGTNKTLDDIESLQTAKGVTITSTFGKNNSLEFISTLALVKDIDVLDEIWIRPGEDKVITPEITPDPVYDNSITWTTADDKTATVDESGKITGIKKGDTKVTVTANDDGKISKDILVHVVVRSTDITGTVKDTNDKPLSGDIVKIKENGQTATIADNGHYVFADIDEGTYTVQVIHDNTVIAEYETTIGEDKEKDLVKENKIAPGVTSSYQYGEIENIQADFIVRAREMEVTPKESSIYTDETVQINVKVPDMIYKKDVIFRSENESVATVDENGLVTGKTPGTVKVHVSFADSNEVDKVVTVEVKRRIRKTDISGTIIDTNKKYLSGLTVKVKDTDQETKTDSKGSFAFAGLKEGTYTVIVSDGTRTLAEYEATVGQNKESDTEKEISLHKGITSKYTYGKSETITADFTVQSRDMTVTPKETTIYPDESVQIKTEIPDMIYNTELTYRSEDPKIATVDENGLITGVSEGDVKIHVSFKDSDEVDKVVTVHVKRHIRVTGITGSVTDTNKKPLSRQKVCIKETGAETTTDASGQYAFSNLKEGLYTVTASTPDDIKLAEYEVKIGEDKDKDTETESSIHKGVSSAYQFGKEETPDAAFIVQARDMTVTPKETDLYVDENIQIKTEIPDMIYNTDLVYQSEDDSIATVDENGIITGKKEGDVIIHVSFKDNDEVDKTIQVHVKRHIRNTEITGTIKDTNGKSVSKKTVKIKDTDLTTTTDNAGHYTFSQMKEGTYTVDVLDDDGTVLAEYKVSVGEDKSKDLVEEQSIHKGITSKYSFGKEECIDALFTVQARNITVTPEEADLFKDESLRVQTTIPDMIYKTDLIWSSDNPDIATVDQNGRITGHKKGDVTIHVRFADSDEVDKTITIHVKEKEEPTTQEPTTEAATTEAPEERMVGLKGTIKYSNGKNVKNVTVKFGDTKDSVDGTFDYDDLEQGTYSIQLKDQNGAVICKGTIGVGENQDDDQISVSKKASGVKIKTKYGKSDQMQMDVVIPKTGTGIIKTGDQSDLQKIWLLFLANIAGMLGLCLTKKKYEVEVEKDDEER